MYHCGQWFVDLNAVETNLKPNKSFRIYVFIYFLESYFCVCIVGILLQKDHTGMT